jgi:hypothetical protein
MPSVNRPAIGRRSLVVALAVATVLTACSSGGGDDEAQPLNVQVASFDLAVGPPGRFIVGLLTGNDELLGFGEVQMRFSYLGTQQGGTPSPPGPIQGASYLPIPGTTVPSPPPAQPQVVTGAQARGVYATDAGFDRPGFWQVEVTTTVDGKSLRGTGAFPVNPRHQVPAPSEPALPTDTLTVVTPDTPKAAVDSRAGTDGAIPDPELHTDTIAAAMAAKRPVVAVFATPVYCRSRFCGPVTDMVQELSHTYGDRAAFVHVEVWRDFEKQVLNKGAADWIFRNDNLVEPWVFVIGADGNIVARFDNVATKQEVETVLKTLPVQGVGP